MTKVSAVTPPILESVLPAATFSDAYELVVKQRAGSYAFAKHILSAPPNWINSLHSLRNTLMAPLGLKTDDAPSTGEKFGLFPVISTDENRTVLGFDDKHLDFRIVLDAAPVADRSTKITLTTVVRTHNLFGRAYLAVVLPFHRIIARSMLRQAATLRGQ